MRRTRRGGHALHCVHRRQQLLPRLASSGRGQPGPRLPADGREAPRGPRASRNPLLRRQGVWRLAANAPPEPRPERPSSARRQCRARARGKEHHARPRQSAGPPFAGGDGRLAGGAAAIACRGAGVAVRKGPRVLRGKAGGRADRRGHGRHGPARRVRPGLPALRGRRFRAGGAGGPAARQASVRRQPVRGHQLAHASSDWLGLASRSQGEA